MQKLGSEFPRRPAFLGNELRLPPIWGVLELEQPDTMNQRCTKFLEEILVKDAVHAGLLEQQRTIHQKYLFLRLLVTVFCTEQSILEVHFTSLPVASLTFLQTR